MNALRLSGILELRLNDLKNRRTGPSIAASAVWSNRTLVAMMLPDS